MGGCHDDDVICVFAIDHPNVAENRRTDCLIRPTGSVFNWKVESADLEQ